MNYIKADIKQIQKLYVLMFKKVDSFLKKKNIHYFAVGGTLLGAYRHGGFIPWDNDMDIGMTRDEYNIFLKVARELESDGDLTIIGHPFTNYCEHGLVRIAINGTYQDDLNYKKKIDRRLAIDVFPFDNLSNDEKRNNRVWKKILRIKRIMTIKARKKSSNFFKNIALKIFQFFLLPIPFSFLHKKMDDLATSFKNESGDEMVNFYGSYSIKRERTKKAFFSKLKQMAFENITIDGPQFSAQYLENVYGKNFMTPNDIRHDVSTYYCYVDEKTFKKIY